jgi:hypothetical protein
MMVVDRRHVCLAALVAAPWLGLTGAALAGCGLLLCGDPGRVAAGGGTLALGAVMGVLSLRLLGGPAREPVVRG